MASKVHIVIDQGSDFTSDFLMQDNLGDVINLTGYSANAQIRKWYTSTNSVSFSTAVNTTTSIVTLSLTANQTANIVSGRYVYDVELTDTNGIKSRVVEGYVTVTPEVTR